MRHAQRAAPACAAALRTELVPRTVPRMVCGRKNFQKAPSSDVVEAGCEGHKDAGRWQREQATEAGRARTSPPRPGAVAALATTRSALHALLRQQQ